MRKGKEIHKKKNKSSRNKTIDFTLEEGKEYLEKVVQDTSSLSFADGFHHTIHGDTFEVLKQIPKESIDLLIVDPPYNLSKNYHGKIFDEKKHDDYQVFTKKWIEAVLPSLKKNASIYVCCDWKSSMIIGGVLEEYFHIHNRITWQREKGRGAKTNWKNGLEDIWFASVSEEYTFNVDDVKTRKRVIAPYRQDGNPKDWEETKEGNFRNTHPSNFWDDITIPYWSMKENTAHPTQKPEKLIAKLILASSNEHDVILDPFLGSGTTSVVAKKLKRQYVGIEQNELYCAWTEYRLEQADQDKRIQGYTDGVFWERNTLHLQNKKV